MMAFKKLQMQGFFMISLSLTLGLFYLLFSSYQQSVDHRSKRTILVSFPWEELIISMSYFGLLPFLYDRVLDEMEGHSC